jgi:mRNA-degrading endonuclease HigB of HigAB toxin-antitoxin module
MRIISRKRLREFWEKHTDAQQALQVWYADVKQADWQTPTDIKNVYRNASIVANNRLSLISKETSIAWSLWFSINMVLFIFALLEHIRNMTK